MLNMVVLFKNSSGSKNEYFVVLGKMDLLFDKLRLLDLDKISQAKNGISVFFYSQHRDWPLCY